MVCPQEGAHLWEGSCRQSPLPWTQCTAHDGTSLPHQRGQWPEHSAHCGGAGGGEGAEGHQAKMETVTGAPVGTRVSSGMIPVSANTYDSNLSIKHKNLSPW